MVIGEPLPQPYYSWSQAGTFTIQWKRKCRQCGFTWATVEIPLGKTWDENIRLSHCPAGNPYHKSKIIQTSLPDEDAEYMTPGKYKALQMGAVYRRRRCGKCNGKSWTTLEVPSSGLVVDDVTRCPRCHRFGKLFMKGEKKYGRPNKSPKGY